MILIGELSLWVAMLMAAWGALASFGGAVARRDALVASGARAVYVACACASLASLGLWWALLTSDFSLRYVATHTSLLVPIAYKFAAFWAAPPGTTLFWTLMLSAFAAIATSTNQNRRRTLMPWATGTIALVLLVLIVITTVAANPFERLPATPPDGRGLDPRLQAAAMFSHPPSLYIGYLATTVPFAFAVGALATRRFDAEWISAVRAWSLVSWLSLTIAIVLGMRWVYVEPAWDGGWTWDALRNASLVPWLTTTALLYSIMRAGERRVFRTWNVTLAIASFALSVLAALVTRTGSIGDVQMLVGSGAGAWLIGFVALVLAIASWLAATRLADIVPAEQAAPPGATVTRRTNPWRRAGVYVTAAGVTMVAAALVGNAFGKAHIATLAAGESFTTRDPWGSEWVFTSQGISMDRWLNRYMQIVALLPARNGVPRPIIRSEHREYADAFDRPAGEPSIVPGVHSTLREDVYVRFMGATRDARAIVSIAFNPLVMWCWWGGAFVALGGLLVMWPKVNQP